jgi:hypothetical protein
LFNEGVSLSGQKTVAVGNGGSGGIGYSNGASEVGTNGSNTSLTGFDNAIGGGGGGANEINSGKNGGSGGGAAYAGTSGSGTSLQGNAGGGGGDDTDNAGGGGGSGGVGGDIDVISDISGNGGIGTNLISTFGILYGDGGYFTSGGGGGARNGYTAGTASQGGGTSGTGISTAANDAQKHTGGGGGGAGYNGTSNSELGGSGGSGIVLIKTDGVGKTIPKVTGASFDSTNVTFTVQGASNITNIKYTINGGSEQTTPVGTLAVAHNLSASASITVVAYAVDANGVQISAKKTVTGTIPLLFTNFPSTIAFTGWWNDNFSRWYQLTSNTDTFIQYELYDSSGLVGAEYGSTFTLNSSGILFNVEDTGDTSTPFSYSNGGTLVGTSGIVEVGDSITLWASSDGSGTAEAVFTVPNFFS